MPRVCVCAEAGLRWRVEMGKVKARGKWTGHRRRWRGTRLFGDAPAGELRRGG